jgi:hypothetical protein
MNPEQMMQLANIANRKHYLNGPGVDTNALFAAVLLELAESAETHSLNLLAINELGGDGGPDPLAALATEGTTISSRSAICSAAATTNIVRSDTGAFATATGAAVDNDGTIDIRATEDRPITYGDIGPKAREWLQENAPERSEELERDFAPRGKSFVQEQRERQDNLNRHSRELLDSLSTQLKPYEGPIEVGMFFERLSPHEIVQVTNINDFIYYEPVPPETSKVDLCFAGHEWFRKRFQPFTGFEEDISKREGDGNGAPSMESPSRVRVRDELQIIIRQNVTNRNEAEKIVDRILDRLMEEPRETSGYTSGYANGEWSRRNIEAFLGEVKRGEL